MIVRPARGDLVAAATVAAVLVPQALAYAALAGLPPVHGLYAAVAATLAGALVGSSPYLQTGPVAVTSLLTFGALAPLADPGGLAFAGLAAVLALVVGVVRVAIGLLGGGPIAYLMSQPVIVSFTAAAALIIIATQVPSLLGADGTTGNPLPAAARLLLDPAGWSWPAVGLGLTALLLLLVGRRLSPLFPGALLAGNQGYDGPVVGDVDLGFRLPQGLSAGDVLSLLVPGLVIAVVGFAEPASIARRYAAADRVPWNPNREFVGQGLANLGAGVAGGMPVGGSFSRTALARLSGARTRWTGALTGLVVLALLPFVGALASLPLAVLSGLVIGAVLSLVDWRAPLRYWQWSKPQFLVGTVTALSTLTFAPRVERGVLLGVATALAVHLWREMSVQVPARVEDGVLHLRPTGVVYFGSAPALERAFATQIAQHPEVVEVVLHLDRVGRLDITGALMIKDVVDDADAAGRRVRIRGAGAHATRLLTRVCGGDVLDA